MAPEQIEGKIVDGHTDIYALGIVLYEMFTGMVPFVGENAIAVALKQLHASLVLPRAVNPAIPELLEQGILKCMRKNPADGFASAKDIADLFHVSCNLCCLYGKYWKVVSQEGGNLGLHSRVTAATKLCQLLVSAQLKAKRKVIEISTSCGAQLRRRSVRRRSTLNRFASLDRS
jgi:serine/threonine protein kinase